VQQTIWSWRTSPKAGLFLDHDKQQNDDTKQSDKHTTTPRSLGSNAEGSKIGCSQHKTRDFMQAVCPKFTETTRTTEDSWRETKSSRRASNPTLNPREASNPKSHRDRLFGLVAITVVKGFFLGAQITQETYALVASHNQTSSNASNV
jgi:hypothetical protein